MIRRCQGLGERCRHAVGGTGGAHLGGYSWFAVDALEGTTPFRRIHNLIENSLSRIGELRVNLIDCLDDFIR